MELTEALGRRRMCRDFDGAKPVPRTDVRRLLGLALRAPTAGFSQGVGFVVLDTESDRAAFWGAAASLSGRSEGGARPDRWLRGVSAAPVLVAVLADPARYAERYARPDKTHPDSDTSAWPTPFWHVDAGMAAMSLLLAAEDAGLGALFFGVPQGAHDAVRELLGVQPSDAAHLVGMVALGHRRQHAAENDSRDTPGDAPNGGRTDTARSGRPRRLPFEARVRFGTSAPAGNDPAARG